MLKLSLMLMIATNQDASNRSISIQPNLPSEVIKGYRLILERVSWNEAFTKCQAEGGRLAVIESADGNLAAKMYLEKEINKSKHVCYDVINDITAFWIGGRTNKSVPVYYWHLPNQITKPLEYTNWAPKEPKRDVDMCMEVPSSLDFQWQTFRCDTPFCALCQILQASKNA